MKPIFIAALVLLLLTLCLALIGTILARYSKIRVRHAPNFSRLATLIVLVSFYALTQLSWPGLQLRELDFWSLVVIIGILSYALIWGAVAFQLNKTEQPHFGDSYMLSMLYTDSEQPPHTEFAPTKVMTKK